MTRRTNQTVTLTPAERSVIIEALALLETELEDQRGDKSIPASHPLMRAWAKMRDEARRD